MIRPTNLFVSFALLFSIPFIVGCEEDFPDGSHASVPRYGISFATIVEKKHFAEEVAPCAGEGGNWYLIQFNSFDPPGRASKLHGNKYELWVKKDDLKENYIVGGSENEYVSFEADSHNIVDEDSGIDPESVYVSDTHGISGLVNGELRRMQGIPEAYDFDADVIESRPTSIIDPDDENSRLVVYVITLRINGEETVIMTKDKEVVDSFENNQSVTITVKANETRLVEVE